MQTLTALVNLNFACAIVNVPKTIDNDIPIIDKTFGFETAMTEAKKAIDAAYVEATCNANCIGFVKLVGEKSGFVAMNASLAARVVDICLLPEMNISLNKVLAHCVTLMSTKGFAVVVVSEGCTILEDAPGSSSPKDVDVGIWLKDRILAHFKEQSRTLTIKYIDPTYMIQTVPANASDNVFCSMLAQHAVHGAMAGYTGVTVGKVYERYVYLPMHVMCRTPGRRVNVNGRWYARLLASTKQPDFAPDGLPTTTPSASSGQSALRLGSSPVSINRCLKPGDAVHRLELVHLSKKFPSKNGETPLKRTMFSHSRSCFVDAGAWSTHTFQRSSSSDVASKVYLQMLRSGPRELMHFDPAEPGAAAAIVTCGGICPGLNSVIRAVTKMLKAYGVEKVYGIIGGFKGCVSPDTWIELTEEKVERIHKIGGSILVSDRGNPPHPEIAKSLASKNIRQYFVLGGDGTHKGAMQTFDAMQEIDYECAVVGIPKTIDNDIQLLDSSFGFLTATTEAAKAIESAYVESSTNANCIGLVKLMGRHCGFIALHATLAARNVDICLIPEMDISLPKLLDYVATVMKTKRRAVIVVAEGCGDTIISSAGGTDAGGNKVLADVGPYLKDEITAHLKAAGVPVSIKYIDPTYMIRSVPANAFDSVYCSLLAQQAVHGAMAGYSGFTVGKVDERYVMLPIHSITEKGQRKVDVEGRMFERMIDSTKQPSFAP